MGWQIDAQPNVLAAILTSEVGARTIKPHKR
jgi:hypothetical protein